jgi:hypothetical protein
MHKKNTQRWSKLISTTGILAVLFGGLFAQSVRAVISNPTPVCVGTTCTVTFDSTGDYYLWSPPSGARNVSFDLMGAQGGRTGGLGGRVQGSFVTTPTSLYIYVGGAGLSGSGVAGGFNGGGAAGGSRGDEGSGGGATDIRSTTALADRIVVAAGGGGTGGFAGGAGGAAGGTSGTAGTNGQGQGGSGATQSAGGNGGSPNGGTWGTGGSLGIGGTGGTSTTSGGGGGGGGYYGGGGGGADVDSCCTNGGGGGGGSSWNNPTLTASVVHTGGYRAGAGVAILRYVMPPSVLSFAPSSTLTNATSISYNLVFNESVTGLTNTDFVTTGSTASCSLISVSGSGTSYLVTASGCGVGNYRLTLLTNSIVGTVTGPSADNSAAEVVIERTAPTVTITSPSTLTNATTLEYGFTFSESVTGLTASDFSVTGTLCEITAVSGSVTRYTVQVTRCADGANVLLVMQANSVSDAATNLGPVIAPTFTTVTVDRSASAATWSGSVATSYVSPSFEVSFAEPVIGFTSSDITIIGNATGCIVSLVSASVNRYTVTTSGCSLGSVQLAIAQNSYSDALGNLGPASVTASGVTSVISQPAPIPSPTSTPSPTPSQTPSPSASLSPAPTATTSPSPTPVASGGSNSGSNGGGSPGESSGGGSVISLAPDLNSAPANFEIIAAQPVRKTYAFTQAIKIPTSQAEEPISIYEPEAPQITIDNPTDDPPLSSNKGWQQYAIIGAGGISGLLATIGIAKGASQIRKRRLIRKFA